MKYLSALLLTFNFIICCEAQVTVTGLQCEHRVNPLGIDAAQPRFSWRLESAKRNVLQSAYEINVSADQKFSATGMGKGWKSGKVSSDQSIFVNYKGTALSSGQQYFWRVRVWDNNGKASGWSAAAFWLMGMLKGTDWKAKWMSAAGKKSGSTRPAELFRKDFEVAKTISKATLFITAHGLYEASINGARVGDYYLTPGFTSYRKRLQYQVYDVTALLKKAGNAIGVMVGSGWFRTHLAWGDNVNIYGDKLAVLCEMTISFSDGTSQTVISDNSWRSSTDGPVRATELYDGEIYDARKIQKGWTNAGFDDKGWLPTQEEHYDMANLIATEDEPVRKHEVFAPIKIFTTAKGEHVIDFGQNLVGWVRYHPHATTADSIRISHAEVLDKHGNFYTDNLRAAKQQNIFIAAPGDTNTIEAHFVFQGFRFVKVDGLKGDINPADFSAVAVYSDMPATGTFKTSDAMLNQLQHNIQWGQKGNFVDIPTDCPQRDERLGWTGDAQAFSRTASFNMQVDNFFTKWMKDVAADQEADGRVPHVIPNVLRPGEGGSAGWADVATIIPWNMYLAYGDKQILETQYPSMQAWIGFMEKNSRNDLWNTGFHFGDWLFYRPDDDNDGRAALTDKYLIAQCFFANSVQIMINTATVLGKTDDINKYNALLQKIKTAFLKEYMTGSGRLVSSTQTAYVLALNFDMLPENLRAQAADRLVENIHSYKDHLTTGFLGTPYLCAVLTRFGKLDVAYTLLLQKTYPSWLYPVTMGATTIWERWDGQKPDSTFQTPSMNSFNHYAYGAIGDWMYRTIAGIDTYSDQPGYHKIMIKPRPGGGLNMVSADFESGYGKIGSHWKIENGKFLLDVTIPANTTASIFLPVKDGSSLRESGKDLQQGTAQDGFVKVDTGSGTYHYEVSGF